MVDDHDVSGFKTFAGIVVKAPRIASTRFLGADMSFAANLGPDLRSSVKSQITKRSISSSAGPFCDLLQLVSFRASEELIGLLQRAFEPPRAKKILAAFHQCRFEFYRQRFLQNRNVFMKQLFL